MIINYIQLIIIITKNHQNLKYIQVYIRLYKRLSMGRDIGYTIIDQYVNLIQFVLMLVYSYR